MNERGSCRNDNARLCLALSFTSLLNSLVGRAGFEPATNGLKVRETRPIDPSYFFSLQAVPPRTSLIREERLSGRLSAAELLLA